jgi:TetR/AcrR family transcriptional regulator
LTTKFNYLVKPQIQIPALPTREHTDTEQKIFAAALEVFSEHGRAAARMQDIASRAGINKALVHYYFRSKDKLYEEVFDYLVERYFSLIGDAIVEAETFEDTLRTFIDMLLDIMQENPQLPRFMLREMSSGSPVFIQRMRDIIVSHQLETPRVFIRQFRKAIARKEIAPLDPVQTLFSLLGACFYFFVAHPIVSAIAPDIETHRKQFIARRKKELFSLFYHGLQPRPGH